MAVNGEAFDTLVNAHIAAQSVNILDYIPADQHDNTAAYDCTSAIQDALNSGKAVYFPDRTYLCNGTVTTSVDNSVLYGSHNARIKLNTGGTAGASCIKVHHNNFSVMGLTLETVVRAKAIAVEPQTSAGLSNILVQETRFENVFYAVFAGRNDGQDWRIANIRIIHCDSVASSNEYAGHFFCSRCDGVIYKGNTVKYGLNSAAYGVVMSTRIAIIGNREDAVSDTAEDVEAAVELEDCTNSNGSLIAGNVFKHDIWLAGAQDVVVAHNKCRTLRVSMGNQGMDHQGVNKVQFTGNIAGWIRCEPYGGNRDVTYSADFIDNILDPALYTRNGSLLGTAIYIDGTCAGTIVLAGNRVLSNGGVTFARTRPHFVLYPWNNDFGAGTVEVSGSEGYVWEKGNINPLYKSAGEYVTARLSADIQHPATSEWTRLGLDTTDVNVNGEWCTSSREFTAKKTGRYEFSGMVTVTPSAAGDAMGFRIYRSSGTPMELSRLAFLCAGGKSFHCVPFRTVPLYLNANDVVHLEYFVTGGTTAINFAHTYLFIKRVN